MMAALEVTAVVPGLPAPPNPDEDAWLYGNTQPPTNGSTLDANATEFISQAQNGQNSEEDSDSDDDDVQITIRDITKAAPGPYGIPYQPPQISALPATGVKTVSVIGQTPLPVSGPIQASTKRTIDVNAVGSINGVPIYDYDIEIMCEERPWRIPGADMTDYFNYGFNETSWKAYCDKQSRVRVIAGEGKQHVKIVEQVKINETSLNQHPPSSIYNKHSGGSIDVIGSHKERDTGVPHPISTPTAPRMMVPGMPQMPQMPGMIPPMMPGMFPPPGQLPAGFPQAFPPGLAPPGLAPPPEIRPEIKREDGTYKIPPSSMAMSMAGPLPPPRGMFPMPGAPGMVRPPMLPNMLPPPGAAMVPPMLLPPPLFSDSGSESGSAGEERRRGEQRGERRRSHSREKRSRRTRDHKDRSSDRRDHSRSSGGGVRRERDRKDRDKTRRSSRGDESSRHRHRRDDEGRTKRSRRKRGSKSGGEEEVEEVEGGGKEVEVANGD